MITDEGKTVLLRYIANREEDFAQEVVFGIGETAPTGTDEFLDFEATRSVVDLVDYNDSTFQVIARAFIPEDEEIEIHEVGLMYGDERVDTEAITGIITRFDDPAEWDGTLVEDTGRVGTGVQEVTAAASTTETITSNVEAPDFSLNEDTDVIALAYNVTVDVPTSIEVRFLVDASNYVSYSFTPTAGRNIEKWTIADLVTTGTVALEDVVDVEIDVVAGVNATTVQFDAMRIDLSGSEGGTLVTRSVLTTPVDKRGVTETQVEYTIDVSFS